MGDDHSTDIDWDKTLSERCGMENFDWLDQDTRTPNAILEDHIKELLLQSNSGHNDGGTANFYKKQIWELKQYVDHIYNQLDLAPKYIKQWEKEFIYNKLKDDSNGDKK
tara:strand:+ start:606 stop:932 length:327 start_codon:yes stop_codon:yes gene_type:complete